MTPEAVYDCDQCIARNAEKAKLTPTQLLEEFRKNNSDINANYQIESYRVRLYGDGGRGVGVFRCDSEVRDYVITVIRWCSFAAGTDEKPATLDEMILFALAKWEEIHGKKE